MTGPSPEREQLQLFAAAIYEIRILLAPCGGDDPLVQLAWRLAYALHNDAESVLEGKGGFDVEAARKRIAIAKKLAGETLGDGYGVLKKTSE